MRFSEGILLSHLTNPDSLDIIAREGFLAPDALEVIPTELGRRIVLWCLDRYFESGRVIAPSKQAIIETFGEQMERVDLRIEDESETDTVQFAIADLRAHHLYGETAEFAKRFVNELYNADGPLRVGIAQKYTAELAQLTRSVLSRRHEMTGLQGVDDAVFRLKERQANGTATIGLSFGLKPIDEHMFGVHPGEICTVAAGAGIGKSFFAGHITNAEFRAGRRCLLVSLENDVEMTFDRLVCMATGVPYQQWQRADVEEGQMIRVQLYREQMLGSDVQPVVVQLGRDEATPSGLIRRAQLEDADSLVVDQTSHIRTEPSSQAVKRNEQLQEIMADFKELLRDEYKIPLVLMNQINREGIKAARSSGRFFREHMAEGSAIEQYSDFVWSIFQSELMRSEQRAQLQQLKGRRTTLKHFEVIWRPEVGDIRVKREVQLEGEG